MAVNFTPNLTSKIELTPFRYWCQKILPLAYDDSLSYYELLNKVVDLLNKTMEDVSLNIEDVENLHTAYVQLQDYVNGYFDNLDVQNEINNKLDAMVADGTFDALVSPYFDPIREQINEFETELRNDMDALDTRVDNLIINNTTNLSGLVTEIAQTDQEGMPDRPSVVNNTATVTFPIEPMYVYEVAVYKNIGNTYVWTTDGITYEYGSSGITVTATDLTNQNNALIRVVYGENEPVSIPELTDIRVGADGTTYNSAGNAVRGQIAPILNGNKVSLTWPTSGYVKNDGTIQGYTNFFTTPFIPINGTVRVKGSFWYLTNLYFISCYDVSKAYLGGLVQGNGQKISVDQILELPSGTAFIRMSNYYSVLDTVTLYDFDSVYDIRQQVTANTADIEDLQARVIINEFSNAGFTAFSKFCTVGDSLSVGYYTDSDGVAHAADKNHSWGKYVEKLYGSTCYWTGKAGETTKTWLEQTSDGVTWGLKYTQQLGEMPLYVLCFGANEAALTIGTPSDITAENPTTLYGYVGKVIRELKAISPDCYIMAVGVSRQQVNADTINAVYEYACGYYDKCYYYNVQPMLQSEKFTECYYNYHYSALGYMRMGIYYNKVLNTIMSNNVSDFLYINDAD